MEHIIHEYDYSRHFLFIEKDDKKIYKAPPFTSEAETVDARPYQWHVVMSVQKKRFKGGEFHLIQYNNEILGWVQLEESSQILRFPSKYCRIIEQAFDENVINEKMNCRGIDKSLRGLLFTIKSVTFYKNERYYGVFYNGEFLGFYHSSMLDELEKVDVEINLDEVHENIRFYSDSDMNVLQMMDMDILSISLQTLYRKSGVGEVRVNNDQMFWVYLDDLETGKVNDSNSENKEDDYSTLLVQDLLYSIDMERTKSKEAIKSILELKNQYEVSAAEDMAKFETHSNLKDRKKMESLSNEVRSLKNEKLELKRQLRRADKELELNLKRLNHQKDYNQRLEEQKYKYKNRMHLVEDKLKNLNEKYKKLKNKNEQSEQKN